MSRLTDYLVVISFDCLSSLDLPMLEQLPHFKDFLQRGSHCKHVETIYPSVTYPCHTTIVTGNYPKNHGVVNNTFLQPGRVSPDWYWHRKHVRGTTLYDEAKNAGMKTAALLWPVTARANIDYNMPEIFANRKYHHQIPVSLINGSKRYQLDMNRRFGHLRNGLHQPELDDFVLASTVHTIKNKKPQLLLVHFVDLDSQRHYHGFSSKEAMDALKRHDNRLGKIVQALKDADIYDDTTIAVLGDHSALDEYKAIKLNVLFREHHLLDVDTKGRLKNWKAYCKSCDGSAYIYVKNSSDTHTKEVVRRLLENLISNETNGIEKIYSQKEAEAMGADENCSFMVEAKRGFYFNEEYEGTLFHEITDRDVRAKRYTHACHGYSPEKENYTTILMLAGKGVQQDAVIRSMHLVDEGPTFARLLGLNLGQTDGQVIENFLTL
ncbi:alkaline phosphatase family protein [Fictibacillus sp. b24]|uniref:alkaline phosphatase family protein n=1 Tax=Fictibacillus sp. b24 TaxID=3055863 RepID=UPI0025A29119|nr:alkaline phosphatase family protein [Fictibacillus sp. b24]MDM5315432.1 alkaline phosphatase family protein [Fictibacillus sp. b24]